MQNKNKGDLFVKHHTGQILVLFFATLLAITSTVVLENKERNRIADQLKPRVLGARTEVDNSPTKDNTIIDYQNELKSILNSYIEHRASFSKPHQDWVFSLNKTKNDIMQLSVPEHYMNLHVELIDIIDKEKSFLLGSGDINMSDIDNIWVDFFDDHFWLMK